MLLNSSGDNELSRLTMALPSITVDWDNSRWLWERFESSECQYYERLNCRRCRCSRRRRRRRWCVSTVNSTYVAISV